MNVDEELKGKVAGVEKWACCGEPVSRVRAEHQLGKQNAQIEEVKGILREQGIDEELLGDETIFLTVCKVLRGEGRGAEESVAPATYVSVPIAAAKDIAHRFHKDQVIVVCWDERHGKTHVTTYGKTKEDCAQAAKGGNFVKKALGWPDSMCKAKPEKA